MRKGISKPRMSPWLIPGALAFFLVFAGSRWVTYVGYSPFFATDLLLFIPFLFQLARPSLRTKSLEPASLLHGVVIAFSAYAFLRGLLSLRENGLDLYLIRDISPFFYIVAYYLARGSILDVPENKKDRLFLILKSAMKIHLIWVSFSVLTGNIFGFLQGSFLINAGLFSVRPDFDSAMIAVYCAILLIELFAKFKISNLFFLLVGVFAVTSLQTRAGLLALFSCFTLAILYLVRTGKFTIVWSFVSLGILILFPIVFSFSPAVSRLLITLGIYTDDSSAFEASSFGTINARNLVWQGVMDWTSSNELRQIFGSGFGNDFLVQSATLIYLDDSQMNGVRSPHNWFLGTYARLGIIGLTLAIVLYVVAIFQAIRMAYDGMLKNFSLMSSLILVALLPVCLFGVVLESPFGAIPFYWALGIMSAHIYSARLDGSVGLFSKERGLRS
jgi:O-antigen ligase